MFGIADYVVLGILVLVLLLGFSQGFFRAFGGFLRRRAFIFAVIISFFISGMVVPLLPDEAVSFFPDNMRPTVLPIVTGIVIALVLTLVMKMIGRTIKGFSESSRVTIPSRIFGGVFMLVEYAAFFLLALTLIKMFEDTVIIKDIARYVMKETYVLKIAYEYNPIIILMERMNINF